MLRQIQSDREKLDLHGPVKSVTDEWSTTEFDREGKIVAWAGNTMHGHAERTYEYDDEGRIVRISGSNGDHVDEFHYDERGRKTQVRRIPARPEYRNRAFGFGAAFDSAAEGEMLTDGGTVETTYDERDQPVETKVLGDEGTLVYRLTRTYDANGRLSVEKLTTENWPVPKEIRAQIPPEQLEATLAQLQKQFAEMSKQSGFGAPAERTYVYDEQGRVVERHMRQGPMHEDIALKYNERGDICESTRTAGGFPHPTGEMAEMAEPPLRSWLEYEYDGYGNWISKTDVSKLAGKEMKYTSSRQIVYFE